MHVLLNNRYDNCVNRKRYYAKLQRGSDDNICSDFDHETDLNNLLPVPNKVTVSFNEINVVKMSKFSNLSIPARKR